MEENSRKKQFLIRFKTKKNEPNLINKKIEQNKKEKKTTV